MKKQRRQAAASGKSKDAINLARMALSHGDMGTAQDAISKALLADPHSSNANYLQGCLYIQTGDIGEAIDFLRKATGANTDNPAILNTLGIALFKNGDLAESDVVLRKAVSLAPGYTDAIGNLGLVLQHRGIHDEAYRYLSLAVSDSGVSEKITDAWVCEAAYHGNVTEIIDQLTRLLDRFPANPYLLAWKATVLEDGGHDAEAEKIWRRIGLTDIRCADTQIQRVWRALAEGNLDGARKTLDSVLEKFPCHALGLFAWAHGFGHSEKNDQKKEEIFHRIEEAISEKGLPFNDWANLSYAAGALADALGQYDAAFSYYEEASRQIWQRRSIPANAYQAMAEGIRSRFSQQFFAVNKDIIDRQADGDDRLGVGLIFVAGMPRSGTTLVEQILTRGGNVTAGGERGDVDALVARVFSGTTSQHGVNEAENGISIERVREIASEHHRYIDSIKDGNNVFIDKTPRTFLHFGLLAVLFPRAKFINCVRDPIDTCLSCYFNYFRWNSFVYSYDLETLGVYHRMYQNMMNHWRDTLPAPIFDNVYENLVDHPGATIRALTSFCDLPWDKAFLSAGAGNQRVVTASIAQVRQPLYRTSVARWKPYEKLLSPLLNALDGNCTIPEMPSA